LREEGKEKFFLRKGKPEYNGDCEEKGKNIFEKGR